MNLLRTLSLSAVVFFAGSALAQYTTPPVPPEPPTAPVPPVPPVPPTPPAHADDDDDDKDGADDGKGNNISVAIGSGDADKDVAILVPLGFFLMIAVVFGVAQLSRYKREQRLHDTMRLAIERGLDVDVSGVLPPPRNDRRRGILLLAVGAGVFLFFLSVDGLDSAGMGFVPGMIGLGYLISDRLERRV